MFRHTHRAVFIAVLLAIALTADYAFAQRSPEQSAEADKGRTTRDAIDPITRCALGRFGDCDRVDEMVWHVVNV